MVPPSRRRILRDQQLAVIDFASLSRAANRDDGRDQMAKGQQRSNKEKKKPKQGKDKPAAPAGNKK